MFLNIIEYALFWTNQSLASVYNNLFCFYYVYFLGFTPLMYACESGNAECVRILLDNGALCSFVVRK